MSKLWLIEEENKFYFEKVQELLEENDQLKKDYENLTTAELEDNLKLIDQKRSLVDQNQ